MAKHAAVGCSYNQRKLIHVQHSSDLRAVVWQIVQTIHVQRSSDLRAVVWQIVQTIHVQRSSDLRAVVWQIVQTRICTTFLRSTCSSVANRADKNRYNVPQIYVQ